MSAPSTATGVLIFLVLLAPGFTYIARRDRVRAGVELTPLKETLALVAVSILCNIVAVLVFAVIRIWLPEITPDVGEIVRNAGPYIRSNYALVGWWAFSIFSLSNVVALLAASERVRRCVVYCCSFRVLSWLLSNPEILRDSGWTYLADLHDRRYRVVVGCELVDGTWVQGYLFSYNPKPEETDDRSIVLSAPIYTRKKDQASIDELVGVNFSLISASQIVRLDLSHVDDEVGDIEDAEKGEDGQASIDSSSEPSS